MYVPSLLEKVRPLISNSTGSIRNSLATCEMLSSSLLAVSKRMATVSFVIVNYSMLQWPVWVPRMNECTFCLSFFSVSPLIWSNRIYRLVRNHWNRPRFNAIKNQYQVLYRNSLRRAVEGETTGKYEKALVGIIEQN